MLRLAGTSLLSDAPRTRDPRSAGGGRIDQPDVVRANTNASTVMIGERAADLIIEAQP